MFSVLGHLISQEKSYLLELFTPDAFLKVCMQVFVIMVTGWAFQLLMVLCYLMKVILEIHWYFVVISESCQQE